MGDSDSLEAKIDTANEEIGRLRGQLLDSERQIARVLDMFEQQRQQLISQQGTIVRLDRLVMDITSGRVWRTLRAAGSIIDRIVPIPKRRREKRARRNCHLVCDDPLITDMRPRSGKITVRGWSVAEGGIDVVQLEVPGQTLREIKPSIPRPDVQKSLPTLDSTGRAGFAIEFDSLPLSKGRHPLFLRALSNGEVLCETKTFVQIDHEKGFASDYGRWIYDFERPDAELIEMRTRLFDYKPLISIVMPVYNTKPAELSAAIDSVLNQSYQDWELCIADDCSTLLEVREIVTRYADRDSRIKVTYRAERGGISRAANSAWSLADGAYVCFLDHDDTLAQHALAFLCEALNQYPAADLIYSDEDKIDEQGKRFDPFFKPEWSPDLILSENYVCHLMVLRRDLAKKAGCFNPEFDGSQDYDLVLRAAAQAAAIRHIPRILYHWRAGATSTASNIEHKSYTVEAARKAIEQNCLRVGEGASVEPGAIAGRWRVRYPIPAGTRVSIIIASGGKIDALRTNLDSLFAKTGYHDYEVVVIDNSKSGAIEKLVGQFRSHKQNLRYIDWRNKPFNYSAINNAAARLCDSPVLLFLNDDTSVIRADWLEAMLELAVRPEVGAVGAKLLYPNGAIQHAGVVMGVYDNCGHAFKGLDGAIGHYFDFTDVIRNVSAVTGACLMTRRDVFWQAGGFDEDQFAVAFNDVDLCLKMGSYGYRVLYTPHAVLYHHESLSKTLKDLVPHPDEVAAMRSKWEKVIVNDPYYNPNLTRTEEDFSLRTRM